MGQNDLLIKAKPQLNVKEFQDLYLRKNFDNLKEYFSSENQMLGFKFFELSFTGAVNNQKVSHGLGVVPQDIIATRISGPGTVQFNWSLFDNKSMDLTVTGACRIRFFAGSYWNFNTTLNNSTSDITQYFALAASSQNSTKAAQSFPNSTLVFGAYASTVKDANNIVLVDASISVNAALNPAAFPTVPLVLPKASDAYGTGIYTFKKVDNTVNQINIVTKSPDVYAYTTDTIITLATQGDTVSFIATPDKWVQVNRTYPQTWTNLNWTVTTVTTNALADVVTLNAPNLIPRAVWRRDGPGIRIRFGFQNGTPATTGTAGILSLPLVPGLPADIGQLIVSSNGVSQNGFCQINRATTAVDTAAIDIPTSGSGTYMRFVNTGASTFYTLGNANINFGITGEVFYLVNGWGG